MDAIWEYIKLIPLFIYKWADVALQWLSQFLTPALEKFGTWYDTWYNADMIVFIGSAVILVLSVVCWILLFREVGKTDFDNNRRTIRVVISLLSLFLYGFVIIWIVAMLTHPLNDFGSYLLNDVFEQEVFVSFTEGVRMLPKLPEGSGITLENFLYWHDLMAIGAVFVMCRFAFTTVGSLLTFRIFKLIRFFILTLSFIILGLICGKILTFVSEAGEGEMLIQLISMPVWFFAYMFPMAIVWIPVAVVYGGPIVMALGTILGATLNVLGIGSLLDGASGGSEFAGTAEYTEMRFGVSQLKMFDSSGLLSGVFYFWGGGLL